MDSALLRCHRLALVVIAAVSTPGHAEPITVRAAVDLAMRGHPVLGRGAADRAAAEARIGQARAPSRPQVSTAINVRDDYRNPQDLVAAMPTRWENQLAYDAGLSVSQLITDSGRTSNQIDGARAAERQARSQLAVDRLDIELAVVQAYLDILRGKDLVAVSTGALALVEEQLTRAKALFKATLRPEIDVLSAQTQLAQARLARVRDENAVETARLRLQNAIGLTTVRDLDALPIEINPLADEARPLAELAAISHGRRPELAVVRDGIAASEADVRIARTRTSPVLTASTGVYANALYIDRVEHGSFTPGVGAFASLGLAMDLYLGGADTHEIREMQARVRSGRAELERVEQAITLSVGRATLAVQISREALEVARAWSGQAQLQLALAQSRYKSGVGDFVELNDARTGLVDAQRQEVQARYDLALSRVALARELGRAPTELATQP